MKASVTTTAQAPTILPAPVKTLFLAEFSQSTTKQSRDPLDPHKLQLQADTITVTLREIMVEHSDYRHFGLND
jgi:hypothetical protein